MHYICQTSSVQVNVFITRVCPYSELWMELTGVQQIVGKLFACKRMVLISSWLSTGSTEKVEHVQLLLVIFISLYNLFKKE